MKDKDNNLIAEAYADLFRTDGSLSTDHTDMMLLIRDEVEAMGQMEHFEANLDKYLETLRDKVIQYRDV